MSILTSCLLYCGLAATAAAAPDFTVHEWGTFTSVYSSDGRMLPGLEREEEALPGFVYSHAGMGQVGPKGWTRPLANVTVKMETPVLYFYSHESFNADVRVDWSNGSISQWCIMMPNLGCYS